MTRTRPSSDCVPSSCLSLASMQEDDDDDDGQLTPTCHPNAQAESSGSFFSRVKQTFSNSPLGNILAQNGSVPTRPNIIYTKNSNSDHSLLLLQDDSPALTPRRVSTVNHVFTPMPGHSPSRTRSRTASSTRSDTSTDSNSLSVFAQSFSTSCFSPISLASQPTLATSAHDSDLDDKWSPVLMSPSEVQSTPPLTPATSHADMAISQSPKSAYSQTRSRGSASISICDDENMSTSSDDKKGKRAAPPFSFDTLLADILGPSEPSTAKAEVGNNNDDVGDWWGLEYTLELSHRDSRASDTSSGTTGEHSKSHESWAAIHEGGVPPFHGDANFQDWQHWHLTLDKMELRHRRKRTIDFIEDSEHQAGLYVDEMLAQRAIQIHEELLTEDELYDALVWVEYAAERRPDPFFPAEKHNLGWVLKGHRSIACLREFEEVPLDED